MAEFWFRGDGAQRFTSETTGPIIGKLTWGFFHGYGLGSGLTFALIWHLTSPESSASPRAESP